MAKVMDQDREFANAILLGYLVNQSRGWHESVDLIAQFRERLVRERAQELNTISIELCVIGQALESTNATRGKQLMTLSRKLHDRALGGGDDE